MRIENAANIHTYKDVNENARDIENANNMTIKIMHL
jgi:hypothetical protein